MVFIHLRKYDAILCYDVLPAGFISAFASLILRKPLYLHCIGTYSLFHSSSSIKIYCMRLVHRQAKKTFILSRSVKKNIEDSLEGFVFTDPVIIPPGVDVDFFYPTDQKSALVETPYCISVGAIKSRKGHDLSIEAFGQIAKKFPSLKYVLVGNFDSSSSFTPILYDIIQKYDIANKVIFLEKISDEELRKLYSHASFFVMTSRATREFIEGFGIVYLEAGLCGLASIGSEGTGAEDAILQNETGIIVKPTIDSIRAGMELLVQDPQLCKSLGENAQKYAFRYAWEKIANMYLSHITYK